MFRRPPFNRPPFIYCTSLSAPLLGHIKNIPVYLQRPYPFSCRMYFFIYIFFKLLFPADRARKLEEPTRDFYDGRPYDFILTTCMILRLGLGNCNINEKCNSIENIIPYNCAACLSIFSVLLLNVIQ